MRETERERKKQNARERKNASERESEKKKITQKRWKKSREFFFKKNKKNERTP